MPTPTDARSVTVTGLLLAVLATVAVAATPYGVTSAGVRPPTCGTPNTPPCVVN